MRMSALITKEVYSSLFIGIVTGAIFASGGSFTKAADHVVSDGLIAAISGTAGIFLFLVILGIIVALINRAGATAAFGRWAKTHIKSRVGAQIATFILGVTAATFTNPCSILISSLAKGLLAKRF